jgi:hypothetical protein
MLSHLTFLHALLGLAAWTTCRVFRQRTTARPWWTLAALHAAPLIALGALYWIDLRHIIVGGGPVLSASDVIASALSLTVMARGAVRRRSWPPVRASPR